MASLEEGRWARGPTLAEGLLVGWGRRGVRGRGVGMAWGEFGDGMNMIIHNFIHNTLYENLNKNIIKK